MEALSTKDLARSSAPVRLVAGALGKVALALLTAVLLGLAFEYVPASGAGWSPPMEPAAASWFTAWAAPPCRARYVSA
jgi:hypothetical protein